MTDLDQVNNDFDYSPTGGQEIDVQVNYRCFFTETLAFYPMEVTGSIYHGKSLSDFKREGLLSYQKDYQRVEIVDVFIGDINQ